MIWTIIAACVASVLIVAAVMLIILRFNQLSMARSLCDEAKRQLVVELRARHGLVPAFIGTIGQVTTRDLGSLELALASAERAPFGPRGAAAENALTAAIDDAALLPGRRGGGPGTAPADAAMATTSAQAGMRDELDMTVHLLHGQLTVLSERIVAVSRLYNANVDRYHRQRGRLLSRIFGGVFRPRDHFTEVPTAAVEPSPGPTMSSTSSTSSTASSASTSSTAQPSAPAPSTPENRPDRPDRTDRSGRGVVEA